MAANGAAVRHGTAGQQDGRRAQTRRGAAHRPPTVHCGGNGRMAVNQRWVLTVQVHVLPIPTLHKRRRPASRLVRHARGQLPAPTAAAGGACRSHYNGIFRD